MKVSALVPALHVFVCANRREAGSPLGAGCGDAGEAVFEAMKSEVAARSVYRAVWVTQTKCLGICPERGATIALYPEQRVLSEMLPSDVPALFEEAFALATTAGRKAIP
jgi:(2Fe-2S) ferredoxin